MRFARYSRWDGSQNPIGAELSVEQVVDAMQDDLLGGMSPDAALRRLMRQGLPGQFGGLQSLLERIREARRRAAESGRLDGFLEQIRERLDSILDHERSELATTPDDPETITRESFLDSLPSDAPGQVSALKSYEFASAQARREFQELLEMLRQEVLSSYFQQMTGAMRNLTPEQLQAMKDMLNDLNALLQARAAGNEPSQEQFDEFMRRHGEFFPENPRNLDELLQALARRMAAMSRLMASLTPEQRAELEALARQMLEDLDLQFQVQQLSQALQDLFPDMPWDEPAPFDGEQPLGLQEGLEAIERLADYEDLERALKADYPGAALEDVDVDKLRRTLGDDAVRDLDRLRMVEKALQEAGILSKRGGKLELTPRGVRALGERALARVFERLAVDRPGTHDARDSGGTGEPTGATRAWQWGDPFQIDVQRTVFNAVTRTGPQTGRIRLVPDDFEAIEAETRTTAATVLLLDMSFSMPMRGNWVPAKRMALALHSLISSKYPEDHLSIVGFSDYARELKAEDLAQAGWEHVYGTNMQHAFNLAGRLLAKHPSATKQILLVTDGEPTAHLVGEQVFFHWPPVRETIELTLKEAMRLAKRGITMNIFMLEDSPALFRFVDKLAKVVAGRVFAVHGEELGEFAVRDYLKRRPRS